MAFARPFADLWTRSSPDLILYSAVQSPFSGPSGGDLWISCFLSQPVVTKQGRKLHKNKVHKVAKHRKFKLNLGFGQGYVYEGIWQSDYDRHLAWAKRASHYGGKWSPLITDPPPISFTIFSCDMWHMTCLGVWTFSPNFSSLALLVCDLWYFEDLEEKAVYRTDPATLGLLKNKHKFLYIALLWKILCHIVTVFTPFLVKEKI